MTRSDSGRRPVISRSRKTRAARSIGSSQGEPGGGSGFARTSAPAVVLAPPAHGGDDGLDRGRVHHRELVELARARQPAPTVDGDGLTGDVAGVIAHEVGGEVRQLLVLAETLER